MKKKGFTLIEVIVAISIVMILASLTVPKVTAYIDKAKNTKVISQGKQIYTAAMWSYSEENGTFNSNSISEAINTVAGISSINEIKVNNKNVAISFTSDNDIYLLNINGDSNGYTISLDNKLIFDSSK
ncbi:type IV pilus assembly protein PilA [Clostridium sp. USBA 49]|jgi:type IV pilus assembly protein PilA|uniref:type II secretion system protein n=1 Tax=Clostridium TaxID=1485 RepID=UPI00099A00E1|nr:MULTISPECIES: type II secretion system protein [Clostridium]SKA76885.1 type IV pilus assembly protein PilA [Clostridium sp. USBA 49]